jgi:predicted alpha/beta superfamily hydrolase
MPLKVEKMYKKVASKQKEFYIFPGEHHEERIEAFITKAAKFLLN